MEFETKSRTITDILFQTHQDWKTRSIDTGIKEQKDKTAEELVMMWKKCNDEMVKDDREKNSEQINTYEQLIHLVTPLIKEIGLPNNNISYSYIIGILLRDGFFSNDGDFKVTSDDNKLKYRGNCLGIQITLGYGSCRHAGSLHEDIYKELGSNGQSLACSTQKDNHLTNFGCGNHRINIINYQDFQMGYDTINRRFYHFIDGATLKAYGNTSLKILHYTPFGDIVFGNKTYPMVLNQIRSFHQSSKKAPLSIKELNEIMLETYLRYDRLKKEVKEMQNEMKPYIKKIGGNIR